MANVNQPKGLWPTQYLNGAPWNGQARLYFIDSTNANAFAIGDPVASSGSADVNGVPGVTLATAGAGNPVRGVIVGTGTTEGLMADPSNLNSTIIPATKAKAYYVMVADDPNILFEVQEVGTGTAFTAAEVGLNADLLAGANNGYQSGWLINNVGEGVGATIQVRLMGLVRRQGNAFGAYAKWLVKINNHELAAGTVGI